MTGTMLGGWSWARALRLVIALLFLAAGIGSGDTFAYVAAGILGVQAVLNVGCCGTHCSSPLPARDRESALDGMEYEEVG